MRKTLDWDLFGSLTNETFLETLEKRKNVKLNKGGWAEAIYKRHKISYNFAKQ